jgi:hypothetical protein
MIKKLLCAALLLTASFTFLNAQNQPVNDQEDNLPKVVINHSMIERFQQTEFDNNALTFSDILQTYSVEEVKLLVHAYMCSDYLFEDKYGMDTKLAEMETLIEETDLPYEHRKPVFAEEMAAK